MKVAVYKRPRKGMAPGKSSVGNLVSGRLDTKSTSARTTVDDLHVSIYGGECDEGSEERAELSFPRRHGKSGFSCPSEAAPIAGRKDVGVQAGPRFFEIAAEKAAEESVRLLRHCAATRYVDVGQIANLPQVWQVGNLPHVFERRTVFEPVSVRKELAAMSLSSH